MLYCKKIYKLWQDSHQSILFLALSLLAGLLAYAGAFTTQRKFVIIVFHPYHPLVSRVVSVHEQLGLVFFFVLFFCSLCFLDNPINGLAKDF